ncbi:hypothetical protein F441_00389 [Phytophthora nicotianae CJ01A1]|uniref:Uncharacterized protein n=1 Tax=Phytophthora nicotianae CJ01A1 TaxID=1317063 RepID=W2XX03_PHYNI|nr:hypothetical protein F441_00389 [Phytophthora nicotianae CJ01A1]
MLARGNTKRQIRARTPVARNGNGEGEALEEEAVVDEQSSDESGTDSPAAKRRRRAADDVSTD